MSNQKIQEVSNDDIKKLTFELFIKFKQICEKHNLKYWIAFGTLLGAARHKDFIPWDDDLDVMMPREDYERLLIIMDEDFKGSNLSVINWKNTKNYPYCIGRFNDSNFIVDEDCRFKYPLGLCIDIYPLDGVDIKNEKFIKKMKNRRYLLGFVLHKRFKPGGKWYKNVLRFFLFVFTRFLKPKHLIKKTERLAKKNNYLAFSHCADMAWNPRFIFETEWFLKTDFLDFHGIKVAVPQNYKDVLKVIYGDYMILPPVEKRVPYHFGKTYLKIDSKNQ